MPCRDMTASVVPLYGGKPRMGDALFFWGGGSLYSYKSVIRDIGYFIIGLLIVAY